MAVCTPNMVTNLHTVNGVQIFQFLPSDYAQLNWTRDQNNPSTADLSVPPLQGIDRLPEIAPWLHWITVWDGDDSTILWTGPIQKVTSGRKGGLVVNAKDPAAYLPKTRSPMSKRWDATDPAIIAAELWNRMAELQGLRARPVPRADPDGGQFDYNTVENSNKLDQVMSDLVDFGMVWTIVSGVPVLGPLPKQPIQTLSEIDFVGDDDLILVRDGTSTVTDVLIKAEGSEVTAAVNYYGQALQDIKTLDTISGVSNVTTAAQAYIGLVGRVRTRIQMNGGAQLHPDAPVTIDQLIPSARFIIEAQGVRDLMQLTQVEVTRQTGVSTVKVTMESALTPGEIQDMELSTATSGKRPKTGTNSAAASR